MIPGAPLFIYGDSISLGAVEVQSGKVIAQLAPTYIDLLRDMLKDVRITVDARVNRTTRQAVEHVEQDSPLSQLRGIVLLAVGGNDADMNWRRFLITNGGVAQSCLSPEEYGQNLRRLVVVCRNAGSAPVLCDITVHDLAARAAYLSVLTNRNIGQLLQGANVQAKSDAMVRAFRAARRRVARDLDVLDVELAPALDAYGGNQLVGIDGVHPSALAHRLIAGCVHALLEPLLRAKNPRVIPHGVAHGI